MFYLYYVNNGNSTKGGCGSELNDCMNDCIQSVMGSNLKFTAEQFKKKLNLKRDEKVSMRKIPAIEKIINYKINLTGDYIQTSVFGAK